MEDNLQVKQEVPDDLQKGIEGLQKKIIWSSGKCSLTLLGDFDVQCLAHADGILTERKKAFLYGTRRWVNYVLGGKHRSMRLPLLFDPFHWLLDAPREFNLRYMQGFHKNYIIFPQTEVREETPFYIQLPRPRHVGDMGYNHRIVGSFGKWKSVVHSNQQLCTQVSDANLSLDRLLNSNDLFIFKQEVKYDKLIYLLVNLGCGCYITTACVNFMGLPDDCHEILEMRGLRKYLSHSQEGLSLIDFYNNTAPALVSGVIQHPDKDEILGYSFAQIRDAASLSKQRKRVSAVQKYIDMTFGISDTLGVKLQM